MVDAESPGGFDDERGELIDLDPPDNPNRSRSSAPSVVGATSTAASEVGSVSVPHPRRSCRRTTGRVVPASGGWPRRMIRPAPVQMGLLRIHGRLSGTARADLHPIRPFVIRDRDRERGLPPRLNAPALLLEDGHEARGLVAADLERRHAAARRPSVARRRNDGGAASPRGRRRGVHAGVASTNARSRRRSRRRSAVGRVHVNSRARGSSPRSSAPAARSGVSPGSTSHQADLSVGIDAGERDDRPASGCRSARASPGESTSRLAMVSALLKGYVRNRENRNQRPPCGDPASARASSCRG